MNAAVLHGNYHARGGGERVAEAMAQAVDGPILYGFGDERCATDVPVELEKVISAGRVTDWLADRFWEVRDLAFMWHGQYLPRAYEFETLLVSGNEFGWYVPPDDQLLVRYIHSTPRSMYDLFPEHGDSGLHRAYATLARPLYRQTAAYPDVLIANSELVQRRIRKYWNRDSIVIYPPVPVDRFDPYTAATRHDCYITVNRLYGHKRTSEIVEAFRYLDDRRLVVVGEGPERDRLERIAPPNVTFTGYLSEVEKAAMLSGSAALIQNARNEDFGIVPIEAYASGTPVIGVRDGFTEHQIRDGETGMLYADESRTKGIVEAVRRFEQSGVQASDDDLVDFAARFGVDRFERKLHTVIKTARSEMDIETITPPMVGSTATPPEEAAATDGGQS